ncbi:hypothetical protein CRM22_004503 [Opisthorchis felineus]|uniref:K Homology domain-containing protein n=1 Tax=Opisthorchis felineus TaxID=147828 RepID=A0A4V3SFC9_OPIFE|nr:hypothetical protein CRM22_004503 [Opisthorchis felineus]
MSSAFSGTDNDYPIRSMGEALTVQARSNRVTLKIDVPYTDHSHVIGRGGRNIKSVMLATQCHIHFPDLNKTNLVEKSNQVSISGHVSRVDNARQRIRDMLPVTFIFELPLSATLQPNVFRNSPFVRQLEEVYEVDVCCRSIHAPPRTRTVVNVKGLSANSRMIKTAVRLLLERYYGSNEIVPITMVMELDATHQTGFFAQKSPEEVSKLVAQTTGAVVSFRKSNAFDGSRGMLDANKTVAKLEFMDSLYQFSRNLSCGNAATIEITGLNVDSVFLARQLITNLLPVVLLFDVTLEESEWLRKFDFARLQQQYDVSIDIRNKPKQLNRSVVVRTNEKNVRAVYTVWQLTTDFLRRTAPSSWILAPVAEQSNDRYSDPGSDVGAGQRTIDASYWNSASCCSSICERRPEHPASELDSFKFIQQCHSADFTSDDGWHGLRRGMTMCPTRFNYDKNSQLDMNGMVDTMNTTKCNFGQLHEQLIEDRIGCKESSVNYRFPSCMISMNPHYKPPPRMLRAAAEVSNTTSCILSSRRSVMD